MFDGSCSLSFLTLTTERLDEQIRLYDRGDVVGAYNFWVSNDRPKVYEVPELGLTVRLVSVFLKWVNELLVAIDA